MSADFAELRTKMVDGQLRTTDVTDAGLLEAMLSMPREHFVDAERDRCLCRRRLEIAPAERPPRAS